MSLQSKSAKNGGKSARQKCRDCRRRKIRCVLPDDALIEVSEQPQAVEHACERCRKLEIDCFIDIVALGRPPLKRLRDDSPESIMRARHEQGGDNDANHMDVEDFIISNKDARDESGQVRPASLRKERLEALLSPYGLLDALIQRARPPLMSAAPDLFTDSSTILRNFDDSNKCRLIDEHLAWQRMLYPNIPSISSLSQELNGSNTKTLIGNPSLILLLILVYFARHSSSCSSLPSSKGIQAEIAKHSRVLCCNPTYNRHTVLALELLRDYLPFILSNNCSDGFSSSPVKGGGLLALARASAIELENDRAHLTLTSEEGLDDAVQDSMQWCRLEMASIEARWVSQTGMDLSKRTVQGNSEILNTLKPLMARGKIGADSIYALHKLVTLNEMWRHLFSLVAERRNLNSLKETIKSYTNVTETLRRDFSARLIGASHGRIPNADIKAMHRLLDTDIHVSRLSLSGFGMFMGVMAASRSDLSSSLKSDAALEVTDNIIDQLTAFTETDPERPAVRRFLEDVGHDRVQQLEKGLTNFITLCETKLTENLFPEPPVRTCAMLLFLCRDLAENHAARLKGWGGLHERVDVHVILLQQCVEKLDSLETSKIGIPSATANMVRALRSIIGGWRDKLSEGDIENISTEAEGQDTFSDNFLEDWDIWPQMDLEDLADFDFSSIEQFMT